MARDFGLVSTSIWNSRKFCALETDDAKLLYFYLLTCPSVNSLGCYVLKPGYASADLGWDAERYGYGIDTLCKANLIAIDRAENLVRIVGFLDHSEIMNVKHGIGAVKLAMALPDCDEKANLLKDLAKQKYVKIQPETPPETPQSDTVSIPYSESIDKPEPKPEPIYSVAKATDGDAVDDDFAKQLFDRAVAFLGRHGTNEKAARTLVGRWRKDHQDSDIFKAFTECSKAGAVDPIPYITETLKGKGPKHAKPSKSSDRLSAFIAGARGAS